MLGWFTLPEHSSTPSPRLGSTGSHLDLISAGRKWRKHIWEAVSGIFQRLFSPMGVQWRKLPCWRSRLCVVACPCSKHRGKWSKWFLQHSVVELWRRQGHASRAPTGLGFTYLFFSKCIWARKVTVLAASPFTRECFFHLQAATCVGGTRDSVRSEKHWLFFPLHPARFQGGTSPLCQGSMQLLCTGSTKKL